MGRLILPTESTKLPTESTKPVCLICSETVALIKCANVKRHYETKHKGFEETYPLNQK